MSTVTIPRIEYRGLKERAEAFDRIIPKEGKFAHLVPPIRSRAKIIEEFKKTGLYNKRFIESLDRGLKRSRYFTS